MELRRPTPNDPRDTNAKTWTWKTGIGKEGVHHILHLESKVLYCRLSVPHVSERDDLILAVKFTHPLEALQPVDMLHVDMIRELRYSEGLKSLEIDHGDPRPFTILGSDSCADIYASIRKSLSKQYSVEQGRVSRWKAIQVPLGALILFSFIGTFASIWQWNEKNAPELVKIGIPAVTVLLLIGCFGQLIVRFVAPPSVEILKVA
jgi:hypothetical protein